MAHFRLERSCFISLNDWNFFRFECGFLIRPFALDHVWFEYWTASNTIQRVGTELEMHPISQFSLMMAVLEGKYSVGRRDKWYENDCDFTIATRQLGQIERFQRSGSLLSSPAITDSARKWGIMTSFDQFLPFPIRFFLLSQMWAGVVFGHGTGRLWSDALNISTRRQSPLRISKTESRRKAKKICQQQMQQSHLR